MVSGVDEAQLFTGIRFMLVFEVLESYACDSDH